MKFHRRTVRTLFWTQKERRNFGRDENRTTEQKTKKIQIQLATTCNKSEQKECDKNKAEL
jgi:G:T-mismatch repair DNA endonuclease (very short patch repair protein)